MDSRRIKSGAQDTFNAFRKEINAALAEHFPESDPIALRRFQSIRVQEWLKSLVTAGFVDEDASLPFDLHRPLYKVHGEALVRLAGSCVWQTDPISESMTATGLWWSLPYPKPDSAPGISIPLGLGTLGYAMRRRLRGADGVLLVDDAEADLRGAVTIEDRLLGQVNALLYPVPPFLGDSPESQLVMSLFLPIPSVFDRAFCIRFADIARRYGRQLLHILEGNRLNSLLDPLVGKATHQTARAWSLSEEVERIASSLSTVMAPPDPESPLAGSRVGFPWVATINLGPLGIPLSQRDPLVSAHIEPESFAASNQLRLTRRCRMRNAFSQTDLDRLRSITPAIEECLWSSTLKDICIPIKGESLSVGSLRLHVSTYLPKAADLVAAIEHPLFASVRIAADRVGARLEVLRNDAQASAVRVKRHRDLEQTLFRSLFVRLRESGAVPGSQDMRAVLARDDSFIAIVTLGEGASGTLLAEEFDGLLRALTELLKATSLSEALVGESYLSLDDQLVLHWPPRSGKDDMASGNDWLVREYAGDEQGLTDLSRALTFLCASMWTQSETDSMFKATWIDDGRNSGRLQLAVRDKEVVQKPPFYFRPPLFSSESEALSVERFSSDEVIVRFHTLSLPSPPTHWAFEKKWPDNGAWHVDDGRLRQHLVESRRAAQLSLVDDVTDGWHPKDGTHDRIAATSYTLPRSNDLQPRPPLGTSQSGVISVADQPADDPASRAVWSVVSRVAGEELDSLSKAWAFPLQVLDHVYFWIIVGIREGSLYPLSDASPWHKQAFAFLEHQLGRLALDAQLRALRTLYVDDLTRKNLDHQFAQKIDVIKDLLSEADASSSADIRHALAAAHEVHWACLTYSRLNDQIATSASSSLSDFLRRCCTIAEQKRSARAEYEVKLSPLPVKLEGVQVKSMPPEYIFTLTLMVCDILDNAVKCCEEGGRVEIGWDHQRMVVSVSNLAHFPTEGDRLVMWERLQALNDCLNLDNAELALSPGRHGMLNIGESARRLRLGIEGSISQLSPGGLGLVKLELFLRPLISDRRPNDEAASAVH